MTRYLITLMTVISMLMLTSLAMAQDFGPGQGNGVCQFIDEDGDGFNDLAPDADGDGIPNGMDEDYVRPEDGEGNMYRYGQAEDFNGHMGEFANGQGQGEGVGQGYGPGDGTGHSGMGPGDGTGFGPGTGDCQEDGSAALIEERGRRGGRR